MIEEQKKLTIYVECWLCGVVGVVFVSPGPRRPRSGSIVEVMIMVVRWQCCGGDRRNQWLSCDLQQQQMKGNPKTQN
jgi:hypothetical protein